MITRLYLLAQKIELQLNDTISVGLTQYPTYMLKINNYSSSDLAKVFVTNVSDFDTLRHQIPKYYFARKQEYNEYYLLGVADISKTQDVELALTIFLRRIDSTRMARNRSTFLRFYTWDNVNMKIVYNSSFKDLSQVDNLYYLKSRKDICKYMACPIE